MINTASGSLQDNQRDSYVVSPTRANKTAQEVFPYHETSYRSAFGDLLSNSLDPVSQISGQYGIPNKAETFSATGGSVTSVDSQFVCSTGTNIGGYGVIRTKRPTIYREGLGIMTRFTALFDTPVANSLQFGGFFNVQDTIAFGYRGENFGIIFDSYGSQEIQELIITAATSGDLTLTLNSIDYTISLTAGTNELNAYEIEAWMNANQTVWYAEQVSNRVEFRNKNAAVANGTYAFSGAGLTGSITRLNAGVAKSEITILETDWNGETVSFDKTKGNVFMIKMAYLGYGGISFHIMDQNDLLFKTVHTIKYTNANIKPIVSNKALKTGWGAASIGSTTNISVKGACASTYIEGKSNLDSESYSRSNTNTSVSTSYEAILTLRAISVFSNKAMLGRILLTGIELSTDSTKEAQFKIVKNASLGATNYNYHKEDESIVSYDLTDHADTGEVSAYSGQLGANGSTSISLKDLNIDFFGEETITVYARVVSGSASSITASLIWKEDL